MGADEELRELERRPLESLDDDEFEKLRELVAAHHGEAAADLLVRRRRRLTATIPVIFRAWETRSEARRRRLSEDETRYYVRWAMGYDIATISAHLRVAGAKLHGLSRLNGWPNQPEVVVFSGIEPGSAREVLDRVVRHGGVAEKTWGGDARVKDRVEIDAILPTIPGDYDGHLCTIFSLKDGWNSGDQHGMIERTRPATPAEYADTLAALRRDVGDRVRVYSRGRLSFDEERRLAAEDARSEA